MTKLSMVVMLGSNLYTIRVLIYYRVDEGAYELWENDSYISNHEICRRGQIIIYRVYNKDM